MHFQCMIYTQKMELRVNCQHYHNFSNIENVNAHFDK